MPHPAESVDIGEGVTISYWTWYGAPEGEPGGLIEEHDSLKEPGKRCSGSVTFDTPFSRSKREAGPFWTVDQREPLTLSPSVLCTECGHHGFIRDGKWVPA